MLLKKQYRSTIINFSIQGNSLSINDETVLESIITSLDGFKFINKNQSFNDLVKIQQKYPKHILIDKDTKPFDELKFIIKVVYNFLAETNQLKNFMLENIEMIIDGNEITIFNTEIFRDKIELTTFSPTIRGSWNNPLLIEKILKKQ